MQSRWIVLAALAAGCADDAAPTSDGVPGDTTNPATNTVFSQLATQDAQPCGYSDTQDWPANFGSPAQHNHYNTRYTYDARHYVTSEDAVDDAGQFGYRRTTEYDAMGNPTHFAQDNPGFPTVHTWYSYDSYGRLVRLGSDYDGDGVEEEVNTYSYGSDEHPIAASLRVTDTHEGRLPAWDKTYHYDERGRVIKIEQDIGPDGTVDRLFDYVYDDAKRTRTATTTDLTGKTLMLVEAAFDGDNHEISWVQSRWDADTGQEDIYDSKITYQNGRLMTQLDTLSEPNFPGSSTDIDGILRTDWRYDGCH